MYEMTLGWSLTFEGVLKNVIQSGWLGAPTITIQ